jgi:hypothetical protein
MGVSQLSITVKKKKTCEINLKRGRFARHQWLTPVVLATWKAGIGGQRFKTSLGKLLARPLPPNLPEQNSKSGRVTDL